MRTRSGAPIALALAALAAGPGCQYAFRNPAESLGAGEVSGRTVAGVEVIVDGASVSVKNAGLSGVSRQNGRFTLLPLPVGRHTLLFRKGTERALQREVEIALGKDGQPEGIWLGDVSLPAAVALKGLVRLPATASPLAPGGVVVDQESGTAVPLGADGSWLLEGLSVGEHHLRFYAIDAAGREYLAGPLALTLGPADAGTRKELARVELRPAVAPTRRMAAVSFRVAVSGDVPGLDLAALGIAGLPPGAAITPDGRVRVEVPEGLWTVAVTLPPGVGAASAPPTLTFAALAGESLELGTLLVVSDAARQRAASACRTDAECAPDTCLASGVCGPGWQPPAVAPASVPFCARESRSCTPGQPLSRGPVVTATCVGTGTAGGVGVVCGSCCTPDGVATLCAPPGQGGCPVLQQSTGGHRVSGTITGSGVGGVMVVLVDEVNARTFTTTTDSGGAFAFAGVADGTYILAPSAAGAFFTPDFRTVVVAGADVTGLDFARTGQGGHAVSGQITGPTLAGVQVMITDQVSLVLSATSDSTGAYTITGVPDGSYQLVPVTTTANLTVFTPPVRTVTVAGADVTGQDFAGTLVATVQVSGVIRDGAGAPVAGAAVRLVGVAGSAAIAPATTDSGGAFLFPAVLPGAYTLIPSLAGTLFSPQSINLTLAGSATGQAFTASPQPASTHTLSGTVRGPVTFGVSVTVLGGNQDTAVDVAADGTWFVAGCTDGLYDLAPSPQPFAGFIFTPAARTVTLAGADLGAVDFLLHAPSISGNVAVGGVGLAGVTVRADNGLGTVTSAITDAGGAYQLANLSAGLTYSVTPSLAGYTFAPAGVTQLLLTADTTVDFSATLQTAFRISGRVRGQLSSGVVVSLSGTGLGTPITTTSLTDGSYSFPDLPAGSYQVTPQGTSVLWEPSSASVTLAPDAPHTDFVAWAPAGCVDCTLHWRWPLPTGNTLRALWGSGSSDVWAVGDLGTTLRYDGVTWSTTFNSTVQDLYGLWGSSASDVWAVGNGGAITHFNGSFWSSATSGSSASLRAVWGAGPTDVWAVGDGVILRLVSGSWTQAWTGTAQLRAVWGVSPGDLWAAGVEPSTGEGVFYHYTAAAGWLLTQVEASPITALWGTSASDGWATSAAGTVFQLAGASWSAQGTGAGISSPVTGWSAGGSADSWMAGGPSVQHWNGNTWQTPSPPGLYSIQALWGASGSDLWAAGEGGGLYHWGGSTWSAYPNGAAFTSGSLLGVWAVSPTDAWAVGQGHALHWNGSTWTETAEPTTSPLTAVWGWSPSDYWLAAQSGSVVFHWTGSSWTAVSVPNATANSLRALSGTGPDDVWAVGDNQAILHYDGSSWSAVSNPATGSLAGVWATSHDDVWAVGTSDVLHWDGVAWTTWTLPLDVAPLAVWASSPTNVWVVGFRPSNSLGAIARWTGTAWSVVPSSFAGVLRGVGAASPNEVFAVGDGGVFVHSLGTTWIQSSSGTRNDLRAVSAPSPTSIFLVGLNETIINFGF